MIPIASEQDKAQLKEHALNLLRKDDFEGLIILVEVFKDTDFEIDIERWYPSWLKFSITLDKLELVKYFIKKGVDINKNSGSALCWAANLGRLEIVKCLVENGANVNAGDDYALYEAASCGHLEVVKYLVSKGSNIRSHRCQALKRAERNNHVEVVKYLEEVLRNDKLSRQTRKETTASTCS